MRRTPEFNSPLESGAQFIIPISSSDQSPNTVESWALRGKSLAWRLPNSSPHLIHCPRSSSVSSTVEELFQGLDRSMERFFSFAKIAVTRWLSLLRYMLQDYKCCLWWNVFCIFLLFDIKASWYEWGVILIRSHNELFRQRHAQVSRDIVPEVLS